MGEEKKSIETEITLYRYGSAHLLAYPIVFVDGRLRQFSKSKEISLWRIYWLLFQSHRANDRWEIMNMRKKGIMRTQTINFPDQQTLCVFPAERSNLAEAISELGLKDHYPVIVLIGGEVDEKQVDITRRAIEMISRIAEDMQAAVICGGTDMGVMAEIGRIRSRESYKFPLIGVAPEELVTWPGGPSDTKFLWWGKQRWQLESHYSHFILVPGEPVWR